MAKIARKHLTKYARRKLRETSRLPRGGILTLGKQFTEAPISQWAKIMRRHKRMRIAALEKGRKAG